MTIKLRANGTQWNAGDEVLATDLNDTFDAVSPNSAFFGDGSDGNVTISADTTLTRDMYYNNLTINNGIKLYANGYRIFVKGTTTTIGTGNIQANGGNGGSASGTTPGTAGVATPSGTIAGGVNGVAGVNGGGNDPGNAGISKTNVIGTLTAPSGAGGGVAGGVGGTATVASPTITAPILPILLYAINVANASGMYQPTSGSGGGADSNNNGTTRPGGGSGASGGIVFLCSKNIVFSATDSVQVKGGNGGNGIANGLGNSGSGAGGNGGVIILIYRSISGTTLTAASACAGGTGGTGGNAASNGNTGVIYNYLIV